MEEMTVMNVDAVTQNPPESKHIVKAANFRIYVGLMTFQHPPKSCNRHKRPLGRYTRGQISNINVNGVRAKDFSAPRQTT